MRVNCPAMRPQRMGCSEGEGSLGGQRTPRQQQHWWGCSGVSGEAEASSALGLLEGWARPGLAPAVARASSSAT